LAASDGDATVLQSQARFGNPHGPPVYTEHLDALLQAEADYRHERKMGYRIKVAKVTLRPAFEDIDFTASRSLSKAQVKELYGMQWLHDARPVLLIGPTGVGKTFLAQARPTCLRVRQLGLVHDADLVAGKLSSLVPAVATCATATN
jgi:hypothetical protein